VDRGRWTTPRGVFTGSLRTGRLWHEAAGEGMGRPVGIQGSLPSGQGTAKNLLGGVDQADARRIPGSSRPGAPGEGVGPLEGALSSDSWSRGSALVPGIGARATFRTGRGGLGRVGPV